METLMLIYSNMAMQNNNTIVLFTFNRHLIDFWSFKYTFLESHLSHFLKTSLLSFCGRQVRVCIMFKVEVNSGKHGCTGKKKMVQL